MMIAGKAKKAKKNTVCCLPLCGKSKTARRRSRKRSITMTVIPINPLPLKVETLENLQPRMLHHRTKEFIADQPPHSKNREEETFVREDILDGRLQKER